MFALSLVCHVAVFALIYWLSGPSEFRPSQEQVTYVDVVNLPVASPQAGTPGPPARQAEKSASAPAPAPPPAPHQEAMTLPTSKPKPKAAATPQKAKAEKAPSQAEDSKAFDQRLSQLKHKAEEKSFDQTLSDIAKSRAASHGPVGIPGGTGKQAGSDYASYIQSRLKDAFKDVIASQTKAPQVLVRITIGTDGRLINYRVEKKSGDPVFDDSVARAVTLASRYFKPPPSGKTFERVFRFKPEGVGLP